MEANTSNSGAKIMSALIIGLIIGFAAGAFWEGRRLNSVPTLEKAAAREVEEKSLTKDTAPVANTKKGVSMDESASPRILIEDQMAGSAVTVGKITVTAPVWIAVREQRDGGFGNILGASKVFAGENSNVVVELLRPTKVGATYYAVLHQETGSPAFNYREDLMIEGSEAVFKAK